MTDQSPDRTDTPDPSDPLAGQGADPAVIDTWTELQADIDAIASEYHDDGWETTEIHPGDVAVIEPGEMDRWGIDVLVPDDELETVRQAAETGAFDELEVYRTTEGEVVFLLIVARDEPTEHAILIPAYYHLPGGATLRTHATERGVIHVHLRPLTQNPIITFSHHEPELFFPGDPDA